MAYVYLKCRIGNESKDEKEEIEKEEKERPRNQHVYAVVPTHFATFEALENLEGVLVVLGQDVGVGQL